MLVEFSVTNFLSFKKRTTLSLVAVRRDRRMPGAVTWQEDSGYAVDLLHSIAVFGANASGKSNIIESLLFMSWFVTESLNRKVGKPIPVRPFKFCSECKEEPSAFEAVFYLDNNRYEYGFALDQERVRHEWLHSYPESRRRILFERDATRKEQYYFGGHWKGQGKSLLRQATRPDVLFLSLAANFNNELALSLLRWFDDGIQRVSSSPTSGSEMPFTLFELLNENPETQALALRFLKAADLGISDFQISTRPMKEQEAKAMDAVRILFDSEEVPDTGDMMISEVSTTHQAVNKKGESIEERFRWSEESDGTHKIFSLAGPLIHVLRHGCILLADELDTRLHPLLTRELIRLFRDKRINRNQAQLIFTAHDTSLLSQSILRRDQVWLTHKAKEGATDLYSLWDYKTPRTVENIRKGYLSGRYGAVPLLGSFSPGQNEETQEEIAQ